ncbi:endonuclease/exonuclease/phosphatase family protein [Microbacterium sp. SSW1-59]|uniref:endonuclease/exonuclease/phosphatase family protein n=1 Tax=Microbacterium xanthum TaxID=3079794 RepID=UPI002AD44CBD|nr:endonuclease/exonuclease/phosphatase family protein [Microbacterium sp. SSW1-59]MDZ8202596.1 endonuclease/exonuclease/phosphatase family protein [Microbacterium sp. SSW1-59]
MGRRPLIGATDAPWLHVMTFNIRRRLPLSIRPADRWVRRRRAVEALLRIERPSILGIQEAMPSQADAVEDALGGTYRRLGHGRGRDGQGEGCPLFWDSERLELVSGEQVALSPTPSVAGSRGWGNPVPRIAVVARLRDRSTHREIVVVNTHLDVFSRRARLHAVRALHAMILDAGVPGVLLGDMNARPGSATARELWGEGLRDTWPSARRRLTSEWATFADYRSPRRGPRIDWIGVTGGIDVASVGVNTFRTSAGWPSDHLPVHALLKVDS